jgi:HD-GYP domain-containing protein (c-di-GMP phosphodiesterase class II)
MSSHPQSGAPSPGAEDPAAGAASQPTPAPGLPSELALAALVRLRGAPLLDALEDHFRGSREQAEAASAYAFAAAVELGMARSDAEVIREAAKLHDVGRVYVPVEVLAKPAWRRSRDEGAHVQAHHEWGAELARGAGVPDQVCDWIRDGAERYDGRGPRGIAGAAIPIQSRISRAAYACYAALTHSTEEPQEPDPGHPRRAGDVLRASAGHELDPDVVEALAAAIERSSGG